MVKNDIPDNVAKIFAEAFVDKNLFLQFLESFPYLVQIFAPDGTSVYTNQVGNDAMNVADASEVVGKYNVLLDPVVNDVLGLREDLVRAFKGEKMIATNVRVPFEDLSKRYTQKNENFDQVLYEQIYSSPLYDKNGKIQFIAMVFQTTNTYNEKAEIVRAKGYMNENWQQSYDINKIAKIGGYSSKYFIGLFKKHTRQTPYEYYKHIKIERIKQELVNPEISISEAFNRCDVEYSSTYRRIFKEITGMTPLEYKKSKNKK